VQLVLLFTPAETIARSPAIRTRFPFHSVNSPNPDFDARLQALDRVATSDGRVDCIILGSSMVNNGFDQEAWNQAFGRLARVDLTCVQFGIGGMVAAQVGDIAQILDDAYNPQIIVYGTSARDYSDVIDEANILGANDILDTPWVRYRLGRGFTLEGWLIDHSYAFHYSLGIRQWLHAPARSRHHQPARAPVDLSQPPDPVLEQGLYQVLANYDVSPRGLAGLEKVLALEDGGVQVFVVEMPVHPTYVHFFGRGEKDIAMFREQVGSAAAARNVPFWPVDPNLSLPDSNWMDRNHLNAQGRTAFTQWLASKLAAELIPVQTQQIR
jgi:hypothetical protein